MPESDTVPASRLPAWLLPVVAGGLVGGIVGAICAALVHIFSRC